MEPNGAVCQVRGRLLLLCQGDCWTSGCRRQPHNTCMHIRAAHITSERMCPRNPVADRGYFVYLMGSPQVGSQQLKGRSWLLDSGWSCAGWMDSILHERGRRRYPVNGFVHTVRLSCWYPFLAGHTGPCAERPDGLRCHELVSIVSCLSCPSDSSSLGLPISEVLHSLGSQTPGAAVCNLPGSLNMRILSTCRVGSREYGVRDLGDPSDRRRSARPPPC